MSKNQLYSKLAVERCRVYTAQLCAANHLTEDNQDDTMEILLKGLNRDLDILERCIQASE